MSSRLTATYVNLIVANADGIMMQLLSILSGLDGLPSSVLANLCDGLIKLEQATHASTVQEIQRSASRLNYRLQIAMDYMQQLKSNGREQEGPGAWVGNALDTMRSVTCVLSDTLREELEKEKVNWLAEETRSTFIWIQATLTTMNLPRANFQDNFLQRQAHIAFLRTNLPVCIERFAQAEGVLERWKQIHPEPEQEVVNSLENIEQQALDNLINLMNSLNNLQNGL